MPSFSFLRIMAALDGLTGTAVRPRMRVKIRVATRKLRPITLAELQRSLLRTEITPLESSSTKDTTKDGADL